MQVKLGLIVILSKLWDSIVLGAFLFSYFVWLNQNIFVIYYCVCLYFAHLPVGSTLLFVVDRVGHKNSGFGYHSGADGHLQFSIPKTICRV